MICPNCGEPVRTRHSFCVVCNADLSGIKPEPKVRIAGQKLRDMLTTPVSQLGKSKAQPEPEPAEESAAAAEQMHPSMT